MPEQNVSVPEMILSTSSVASTAAPKARVLPVLLLSANYDHCCHSSLVVEVGQLAQGLYSNL